MVWSVAALMASAGAGHAAGAALDPPLMKWSSTLLTGHPLVGRVWSAAGSKFIAPDDLARHLAGARYVLLGETHDNPDHHRWQGWLVDGIARIGKKAGQGADTVEAGRVAFEMVMSDKADRIPAHPGTPAAFAEAVEWEKSGWPPFVIYQPVVAAAINAGFRIVPASPPRDANRTVSKNGLDAIGHAERARLALADPLATPLTEALAAEIKIAHCNMMPDTAIGGMVNVQRYRDAIMADALIGKKSDLVSILIAGSGHVRRDRGVPWYLAARGIAPGEIANVIHVEVEDGKTDPAAYVPRAPDGGFAADYVVFTPATARPDQCEKLRSMPGKPR